MTVDVRPAIPDDVAGIREVARRAWHEAHAPIVGKEAVESFLAEYYDAESVRERIESDGSVLPVAESAEGDVVGYAFANPTDDEGVFGLSQIYVKPDRWGDGIGGRLLDRIEREVDRRGGGRITLSVMAGNDRAIGFYESAGYVRTDEFYDDRIDTRGFTFEKEL